MTEITALLFSEADKAYADFQAALMPNISRERVIGVRMPTVRKIAKRLSGTPIANDFLRSLPHGYYDEENLHAALIELSRDFDECIALLEEFLPTVDNWASCDMMSPKVLKKDLPRLEEKLVGWLASPHEYTVRFAVVMLMKHFSGDLFSQKHPKLLASLRRGEYYIKTAVAWYFATLLATRYESVIPYFERGVLDEEIRLAAIKKANESFRVTEEQKTAINEMR